MARSSDSNVSATRRQFLTALTAAAALPKAFAAEAPTAPAGPRLHVFAKPLQWLSFDETAELVAEAGFGGIDFAVRPGGHVLPEKVEGDLPRAVAAARKAGLAVEMITTAITNAADERTAAILKTAAGLGIRYYRFGTFSYDNTLGVWESLQQHKVAVRGLARLNETHGIHGAFQNHSGRGVGAVGWDLYELLREQDPRWIGCQHDIRHATAEGGQSWPVTMRLLAPWIRCTDVKDFRWEQSRGGARIENVPLGEGIVDFKTYFGLVRELKLSGPVSVHFEYPPFERGPAGLEGKEKRAAFLTAMRADLRALKSVMGGSPAA
jgi:L-ribulose-5-phosphate 3-epimerase